MRIDPETSQSVQDIQLGLALGGGVARGWAHIGAIKALTEADIRPDIIAGTSIGAVVGGAYLAGKLDILEKWALALNRRRVIHYMDLHWGGSGLMRGKRLERVLRHYFQDSRIEDFDRPFAAIACDLRTGYEVWLQKGELVPAIRASYSLPGAFSPVALNGRFMMDGALVNPIPVSACRALGAQIVIAIDLHGDAFGPLGSSHEVEIEDETTDDDPLHMAGHALNRLRPDRVLLKSILGSNHSKEGPPKLGAVMMGTLNIVMDRLARSRLAGDPPDVFVIPQIGHIGLLEFTRASELIALGYEAMQAQIPLIKSVRETLNQLY